MKYFFFWFSLFFGFIILITGIMSKIWFENPNFHVILVGSLPFILFSVFSFISNFRKKEENKESDTVDNDAKQISSSLTSILRIVLPTFFSFGALATIWIVILLISGFKLDILPIIAIFLLFTFLLIRNVLIFINISDVLLLENYLFIKNKQINKIPISDFLLLNNSINGYCKLKTKTGQVFYFIPMFRKSLKYMGMNSDDIKSLQQKIKSLNNLNTPAGASL